MEEQCEKDVSDATSSGYEVCTSSNRRANKRDGLCKEKEILSDDSKHANVFDTFFLQSLLNSAPFNLAITYSPRVRTLFARKNEEAGSV